VSPLFLANYFSLENKCLSFVFENEVISSRKATIQNKFFKETSPIISVEIIICLRSVFISVIQISSFLFCCRLVCFNIEVFIVALHYQTLYTGNASEDIRQLVSRIPISIVEYKRLQKMGSKENSAISVSLFRN